MNPGIDSVKDSKDVSNVLMILDNQTIRTNPFGANVSGDNSYKRAERITAGLHLITNHVPEEEPLREMIRRSGLDLLDCILELRAGLRAPASEKGQAALAAIRKLISLVRLLAVAGYVSVQNANAVADALDELGSLIVVSQRSILAEQLTVKREDLIPPAVASHTGRTFQRDDARTGSVRAMPRVAKEVPSEIGGMPSDRSQRIVDILNAGGMLGIKDISANLPQYSEKMVQRVLSDLVREGKVRKIGAKRWSKYEILR